jgi:hypothetical protein
MSYNAISVDSRLVTDDDDMKTHDHFIHLKYEDLLSNIFDDIDDNPIGEPNEFFNFIIEILHHCEEKKDWRALKGTLKYACGYTAPGAAILIDFCLSNGILNSEGLQEYITGVSESMKIDVLDAYNLFIFYINETTGNLLNIADVYCSGTENKRGIDGEIARELWSSASGGTAKDESKMTVYRINDDCSNLKEGANIISFTHRDVCTLSAAELVTAIEEGQTGTFHHATLWIDRVNNICVIVDSWGEKNATNGSFACRPLKYDVLNLQEVIYALHRINADDATIEETFHIFEKYFPPVLPEQFFKQLQEKQLVLAITVNPLYVEHVSNKIFENTIANIGAGYNFKEMTELGGKPRKKTRKPRKKTRKPYKRSKKYRKSVRKYKK